MTFVMRRRWRKVTLFLTDAGSIKSVTGLRGCRNRVFLATFTPSMIRFLTTLVCVGVAIGWQLFDNSCICTVTLTLLKQVLHLHIRLINSMSHPQFSALCRRFIRTTINSYI